MVSIGVVPTYVVKHIAADKGYPTRPTARDMRHRISAGSCSHTGSRASRISRERRTRSIVGQGVPGDNRSQWGRRTQLILPVSGCDTNASVRADV